MPVISAFLGMIIRIYHSDHEPPHIHVSYGEFTAIVGIKSGKILKGRLPNRLHCYLIEWLQKRQFEVRKAWLDAQAHRLPKKIRPLE